MRNQNMVTLATFADRLGVSERSLRALGCEVDAVDRLMIPERDLHGRVVGQQIRTVDGTKSHKKGTKRGLVFAPSGEPSGEMVRVDASCPCPVCGHGDWCMVSTNGDVVLCGRTEAGSFAAAEDGQGWLHRMSNAVLPPSDLPVVLVEGMTDVASAMDMGFVAVGRPSARSVKYLDALLAGRDVLIVADRDGADGKGVGLSSAFVIASALKAKCPSVRIVQPPVKDLREWYVSGQATAESLLALADADPPEPTSEGKCEVSNFLVVGETVQSTAEQWLKSNPRLFYDRGTWFERESDAPESGAVEVAEDVVEARLREWLHGAFRERNGSLDPVNLTKSHVADVMASAVAMAGSKKPVDQKQRQVDVDTAVAEYDKILGFRMTSAKRPDVIAAYPVRDGLLDCVTGEYLTEWHLPEAVEYDPNATCPRWQREVLDRVLPEQEYQTVLRRWVSYILMRGQPLQKFLFAWGRSSTGKSVLFRVLADVFAPFSSGVSLDELSDKFGRWFLLQSRFNITSEVSQTDFIHGGQQLASRIKTFVSPDPVSVSVKYRPSAESVYSDTKLVLVSNYLPAFHEINDAINRRMIMLPFVHEISRDVSDPFLERSLLAEERAGIFAWAVAGLPDLIEHKFNGLPTTLADVEKLTKGSKIREAVEESEMDTNPVGRWVKSAFVHSPGSRDVVYVTAHARLNKWLEECGLMPVNRVQLTKTIRKTLPDDVKIIEGYIHNVTWRDEVE